MSAIRCHFDGKVFVPDEPVEAKPGERAEVRLGQAQAEFTGGPGGTMADLLKAQELGGWDGIFDPAMSSAEAADELRRRSSVGSYHKQRAMLDLQEYWDEKRREQNSEPEKEGS